MRCPRPAGQEVGLAAPELAGAAPGEQEPQPAALDQPVYLVEEARQLLNLVDHDPRARATPITDEAFQQAGVGGEPEGDVRAQQVDHQRPAPELRPHQEALARGARSQEEEGFSLQQVGQREEPLKIRHRYC